MSEKAILALKDGTLFEGRAFGARGEASGEVVFNTSMTGYQEITTDPSYKGQIVAMTYPLIGNVGCNEEDFESARPQVEGFIVREASRIPSSWRSRMSLDAYLERWGIVGIEGIDTRSLTKHIRTEGAMDGVLSSVDLDHDSLLEKARAVPSLVGRDLVREVTCEEPYGWEQAVWSLRDGYAKAGDARWRVAAFDYGIKQNILRNLVAHGCDVVVAPATAPAEWIIERAYEFDGIFLSNGPGDPAGVPYAAETVATLLDKLDKPLFGICLGHQILALALGAKTFKLKFGHRGANQPVMDLTTEKVEITCQNHGFAVDIESLPEELELTHINLNDKTCEGLRHKSRPVFSVQYHPEASPGPHDASYLFRRFVEAMEERRGGRA
ncbi:glutamine-hydrolyzing carbamoyl-phosphate synthase small subunit [Nitrospinae bacterium AH-259-F20]|nr:glutamine-hydrolyzing carbamoyl-phosphate synthase small subunit [Nitrospinae bacterium AH-259-F20]